MLEHVEKGSGLKFLSDVKSRCKYAVFTVPINPGNRGAKHGNIRQAHVSKWTEEDLSKFGNVQTTKS
jgi:hypothetical protein